MITPEEFDQRIERDGVVIFPDIIPEPRLVQLRNDVEKAYAINRAMQKRNGVDFPGVAHHMIKSVWRHGTLCDLLEEFPLKSYIDVYFGGPYILNTISGIINFPESTAEYQNRPHRDIRSYFPVRLSINLFVFLDDFTKENGATHFLRGSHLKEAMPTQQDFDSNSEIMLGKAGSIAVFNSDLVHAGGKNITEKMRRGLSYTLVRPFMKQQCQYHDLITDSDSEWMKQLLGYNARTAKDLNEWYQPPERRMYKSGQG